MKKVFAAFMMIAFVASFISFANAEDAKKDGKTIFTEAKCMNCHGISALTIEPTNKKSKAPDLSTVGDKYKNAAEIGKYLMKEAKFNDKNHPVKFGGTQDDLNTLTSWFVEKLVAAPAK